MADSAPAVEVVADVSVESVPQPCDAIPVTVPAPAPAPAAAPKKQQPKSLLALLASAPASADTFLARLNKAMSTPSGIDTVLLLLCYTSKFAAQGLTGLSTSVLHRSAREWLAVMAALPSGKTVTAAAAVAPKTATTAAAAAALTLAGRLNNLSSLLSEARTITRLWALLGLYFWGKGMVARFIAARRARKQARSSSSSSGKEVAAAPAAGAGRLPTTTESLIGFVQLALCVGLQTLENGAYLSQKGVLGWAPATQGKAYLWSVRFWAAFIGIELGKMAAEAVDPSKPEAGLGNPVWRRALLKNLAWAPLTVHWGTPGGLVSETVVGALGSIPGLIQIRDLWASTKA